MSEPAEIEYVVSCYGGHHPQKWQKGFLIHEWRNGNASIRREGDSEQDGWLIIRPGEWRYPQDD